MQKSTGSTRSLTNLLQVAGPAVEVVELVLEFQWLLAHFQEWTQGLDKWGKFAAAQAMTSDSAHERSVHKEVSLLQTSLHGK